MPLSPKRRRSRYSLELLSMISVREVLSSALLLPFYARNPLLPLFLLPPIYPLKLLHHHLSLHLLKLPHYHRPSLHLPIYSIESMLSNLKDRTCLLCKKIQCTTWYRQYVLCPNFNLNLHYIDVIMQP